MFKLFLATLLTCSTAFAGLPPTTSRLSGDSSNVTTFNFLFPYFSGTHTGTNVSLGTLSTNGGGTGLTSYSVGDMLYATGSQVLSPLTIGSAGTILSSTGSSPVWSTATYPTSYTAPAALVVNTNNVVSAASASTANRLLRTDGSTVSFAQAELATDVSGVLPLINGGTNNALTASAGSVAYSDASKIALSSVGISGQALVSGGTGSPTWFAPTAGSVLFAGASGILSSDFTNFAWDFANNRLTVGTGVNSFSVHGATKGSVLTVSAQGGVNGYEEALQRHSTSLGPSKSLIRSRGTEASPSIVSNGDSLGSIEFLGYDGTDYEYGSKLEVLVDGVPGNNDMPGSFVFSVSPDGGFTPAEALRISNNKAITMAGYGTGILHSSSSGLLTSSAVNLANSDVTGTLPVGNGGTGATTFTANGILYGNTTSSLQVTAAGTTGTVLKGNTGSAPTFGAVVLTTDVSGVLPIANGGTNNGSLPVTAGGVVYTDGSKLANTGSGTAGYVLTSNGTSAPTWVDPIAVQGTRQTGVSMSAGTSITPTINVQNFVFVTGNGGAVTITASPPFVTTNMHVGQLLRVCGTSDTNTVTYTNGNNLVLRGQAVLGKDQCLTLAYAGSDGTNAAWIETGRNF